jgi:hypothetical protein
MCVCLPILHLSNNAASKDGKWKALRKENHVCMATYIRSSEGGRYSANKLTRMLKLDMLSRLVHKAGLSIVGLLTDLQIHSTMNAYAHTHTHTHTFEIEPVLSWVWETHA